MANIGGQIDGGRELASLQNQPLLQSLIQTIIKGVNTLATNTATSATGENAAPKAPDSVSVSTGGEYMHVAINHSGPVQRNVRYFTEVSTSPSFTQPLVIDHGSSRTSHPFPLPTKTAAGATQSYYVRSYAQNPGSQPSAPTVVGGASSPTAHVMTGATAMDLAPSTGSGTAPNTGQNAGQGLGKTQKRQS